MQTSDILSVIALGVSLASFAVSAYIVWSDRGRIRARSIFFPAHKDEDSGKERPASMQVEAINLGRRTVILTLLSGEYEDGHTGGTYIGDYKKGIRLSENETFTEDVDQMHNLVFDHRNGVALVDLWFEDTPGRRYPVKGAKRDLDRLFKNERHP